MQSTLNPQDSQEIFAFGFANSQVGKLVHLTGEGRSAFNRTMSNLLGYSPEELGRLSLFDLIPAKEHKMLRDTCAHLIEDRLDALTCELSVLHRQGHVIPTHAHITALRDDQGRFRGALLEVHDVSERKRNQLALVHAYQRQEFVEALAKVGRWDIDVTTRRYFRSDAALAIMGRTDEPNELPFELAIRQFHPDERERVTRLEIEAIEQSKPLAPFETRIIRPDGQVMHVLLEARMMYDDAGRPLTLLGYFLDITPYKQQEQLLREANLKLEAQNEQIRELARLVSSSLHGPLAELQARASELAGDGGQN